MRIGEIWGYKEGIHSIFKPVRITGFKVTNRGDEVFFIPKDSDKKQNPNLESHWPRLDFLKFYTKIY